MSTMSFNEFRNFIISESKMCPENWRRGQAVFNVLDNMGIARKVQNNEGIDCFYNDNYIDEFLECAYREYTKERY